MGFLKKNVNQFGPVVWPAIVNLDNDKYMYMSGELFRIYRWNLMFFGLH